jgi:anti-sigma regulatory factor (Ser/Thr protein kinase)
MVKLETLSIQSSSEQIGFACRRVLGFLEENGVKDRDLLFLFRLAVYEAVSNAIDHGNRGDRDKIVLISLWLEEKRIVLEVEDQGSGFDFEIVPEAKDEERLLVEGGRGIFLLRSLMDKVDFNSLGNRVTMIKYI